MSDASTAQTMSETKSCLTSQCMEFTKHMANKGIDFKFLHSLPSSFNFYMDFTQEKVISSKTPEIISTQLKKHYAAINCEDCDHISNSTEHVKEHIKEHHNIDQVDGS